MQDIDTILTFVLNVKRYN